MLSSNKSVYKVNFPFCSSRHSKPQGKERAALAAIGMTARITIDNGWSANQMESRLATLFQGRFVKQEGQRFSFTYLQVCVVYIYPYKRASLTLYFMVHSFFGGFMGYYIKIYSRITFIY